MLLESSVHLSQCPHVNLVESSFVEQRCRTKVIPNLWEDKQLTKLVFAVLIRHSDHWSRRQFSEIEQ